MKYLILGSGQMGYAVAYDLIRSDNVSQVILADNNKKSLQKVANKLLDSKIIPVQLDVNDEDECLKLFSYCDIVISCLPYNFNLQLTKLCLISGKHFLDLGGNENVLKQQFSLNDLAKEKGVTIIPDLGLAPGLVSLIALTEANNLDEIYEIKIRVGGIPIEPKEPFDYCKLFSINGLINEYVEDCRVIKDGQSLYLPSLTECETITFKKPFNTMEAFYTAGNVNNLFDILKDSVQNLSYKTIRYPGHCDKMHLLKEIGLMSDKPIKIKRHNVVPREVLHEILEKAIPDYEPDAVLIRINVIGVKDRKPVEIQWECIDFADEANGISAMMRMTAYPTSIIAQMIVNSEMDKRGVLEQEKVVPLDKLIPRLAARSIHFERTQMAPTYS